METTFHAARCKRAPCGAWSAAAVLLATIGVALVFALKGGPSSVSLQLGTFQGHGPQCYSTPAADPSEGAWKRSPGGVQDSPAYTGDLPGTWNRDTFQRCKHRWEKGHSGRGPQPYWKWEPSNCRLEEVNAEKFCRVMEGRKGLLLVGDSLTEYMSVTLAAVLRAKVDERRTAQFSRYLSACDGDLKFASQRNDLLNMSTSPFKHNRCEEPGDTVCVPFARESVLAEFDTIVVNSGAHRMAGGIEAYRDMMAASSKELTADMKRLHGDDAILVLRNTPPGHWQCTERTFAGPVSKDLAADLVAMAPKEYQWPTFVEKNKIVEEAFKNSGGDWRLLDAYTPTYLRADYHRGDGDCLHYCILGPIDHWVTLLYNILLVETQGGSHR